MKRFIRFLKENGIYLPFKRAFEKQTETRLIWSNDYEHCYNHKPDRSLINYWTCLKDKGQMISLAFEWDKTMEGHFFWLKMSQKWGECIKKY